jgi:hypothetical protein
MKNIEGKPMPSEDAINWWLDIREGAIDLVAKHSKDSSDQRVIQINVIDGKLVIFQQELAALNLCWAFGIKQKQRPAIRPYEEYLTEKNTGLANRPKEQKSKLRRLWDAVRSSRQF